MNVRTPQCIHRRLGGALLLLCTLTGTAAVYAVHAALPYNTIRLPFLKALQVQTVLPEGWTFFTRNPREERLFVLVHHPSGSWTDGSGGPNGSPHNLFGIRRSSRAQPVEADPLLRQIPKDAWRSCEHAPASCLTSLQPKLALTNSAPDATLCGDIGLVLQKPIPWAWARQFGSVQMPSRLVRLEVQCSRG